MPLASLDLEVLSMILFFSLAPLPRGVPGEGLERHCLKDIVGFGPIPARIRGFKILILALSTASLEDCLRVLGDVTLKILRASATPPGRRRRRLGTNRNIYCVLLLCGFWPVFGQSWAQERAQRSRLEKRCINQRKLSRGIVSKAVWAPTS